MVEAHALRAFVDVEEESDAVAGAVEIVEAFVPQEVAGEDVELVAVVPAGKMAEPRAMWPFMTRVKSRFCWGVGVPVAMVRVRSVVPSGYWAPESMSSRLPVLMTALVCISAISG